MGDFFAFRYGGVLLKGPSADGTAGQFLQTDGSGNMLFATVNTDITGTTAGAPSPAVDGDSDTGLFSPAPDVLALSAGGVEGLRVTESGGAPTVRIPKDTLVIETDPAINIETILTESSQNRSIKTRSARKGWAFETDGRDFVVQQENLFSDDVVFQVLGSGHVVLENFNGNGAIVSGGNTGFTAMASQRSFNGTNWVSVNNGAGLQSKTSTNTKRDVMLIADEWADNTDASRKGRVIHNIYDTAAREAMRMETDGSRGYLIQKAHATAPADSMLPNSSVAFYDDGSGNLAIKLKDGSGTVKTGTVTLS